MNYLAHAYLSFGQPEILVGNMISDYVKGKKQFDYPVGIQKGIQLHRKIDAFTDRHPATQKAKQFLKEGYRLYAGAFVDVIYDHFLAKKIPEPELLGFADKTYRQLEGYTEIFPERFRILFPPMKKENWLYHYCFEKMIEQSFWGLTRRAKYLSDAQPAIEIFYRHYAEFEKYFDAFYPDVYSLVTEEFVQMNLR